MLALKLLFAFSGFGLLAMVAVVGYDIYLALELERLNRRAAVVLPARDSAERARDGRVRLP
ncbi:MAG TPA: hypothetical protein VIH76_11965 [Candidatus Acidoferrales bacterium]